MIPGLNEKNATTYILLGLLITTDPAARDQEYQGPDLSDGQHFIDGFHQDLRKTFQEVRRKVRNNLMHADPGSIRVLEDGSIEWMKQKKRETLTVEELLKAYTSGLIGASTAENMQVDPETNGVSYTLKINTLTGSDPGKPNDVSS